MGVLAMFLPLAIVPREARPRRRSGDESRQPAVVCRAAGTYI